MFLFQKVCYFKTSKQARTMHVLMNSKFEYENLDMHTHKKFIFVSCYYLVKTTIVVQNKLV
jgi:hypothetical protein